MLTATLPSDFSRVVGTGRLSEEAKCGCSYARDDDQKPDYADKAELIIAPPSIKANRFAIITTAPKWARQPQFILYLGFPSFTVDRADVAEISLKCTVVVGHDKRSNLSLRAMPMRYSGVGRYGQSVTQRDDCLRGTVCRQHLPAPIEENHAVSSASRAAVFAASSAQACRAADARCGATTQCHLSNSPG